MIPPLSCDIFMSLINEGYLIARYTSFREVIPAQYKKAVTTFCHNCLIINVGDNRLELLTPWV